jgi:hypothetical protein
MASACTNIDGSTQPDPREGDRRGEREYGDRANREEDPGRDVQSDRGEGAGRGEGADRGEGAGGGERADRSENADGGENLCGSGDSNCSDPAQLREPIAIVRWAAGLGAVTAEAVAVRLDVTVASARGRMRGAVCDGLLVRERPLRGHPSLYAVTRAGLRAAGASGLDPCGVSASGALHLIECARAAAALERCYPDHRVQGERELRREERECRCVLASAELGGGAHGDRSRIDRSRETRAFGAGRFGDASEASVSPIGPRFGQQRHCPDLVLWPLDPGGGLPVAVEVELTVKAPERLAEICQAWARARQVAGVLYLAAPAAERALLRAIDRARAHDRVVVVPLRALPGGWADEPTERTVPSGA